MSVCQLLVARPSLPQPIYLVFRRLSACVKKGTKYALVVDKKVYTLEGHEAELDKYAAQKVTLDGTVNGETVNVASVVPAK